jgi:hypothetical protein
MSIKKSNLLPRDHGHAAGDGFWMGEKHLFAEQTSGLSAAVFRIGRNAAIRVN